MFMLKKILNAKFIMRFTFFTFIISIVFTTVRIILAPTVAPPSDVVIRVKSDYTLMLLQSLLGFVAMLIPGFLERRVKLNIPSAMMIAYAVFLFCAIYLGEVRNFFFLIPHWDTILHTFTGLALGALGFSLVSLLNGSESVTFSLSPIFVAIFSLCFALALGTVWEIYEFAMDSFLKTNMQKFALETGEPLIGQAALADTMKDLIVTAIGAFVVSVIGYIALRGKKEWFKRFQIKHKH
jgi:hypothetical protein